MLSLKKIVINGLMVLGLSFGFTMAAVAEDFATTKKMAEQGYPKSQVALGIMYADAQDYLRAVYWYQKAADQEHVLGQVSLGYMYSEGKGVRQDWAKAVHWYQKAADQGFAGGQHNLAFMYAQGKGVRQDWAKAKEWYGKACDNGAQKSCDVYRIINESGY